MCSLGNSTVHPVEKCSLPPVDEVGSLNNTFGKTFSTSTSSLPITKDNNYKPKIITPGNTRKDFTVTRDSICGDGHCLGDNNLLLEPSTLQQVHSRRCTALPPISRTPPALPRPVGWVAWFSSSIPILRYKFFIKYIKRLFWSV